MRKKTLGETFFIVYKRQLQQKTPKGVS